MTLHVVHFIAPINQATANQLMNVVLEAVKANATELRIHISSDGGSTDYGFALYNFFRSLPIPVTMHNIANIESMAVVVYLAGSKRFVARNGRFAIHPLHWSTSGGNVSHAELREWVDRLDNDAKRYDEIVNLATKDAECPIQAKEHLLGSPILLDGTAAIRTGIAHDIVDAKLPADAVQWWVNAS